MLRTVAEPLLRAPVGRVSEKSGGAAYDIVTETDLAIQGALQAPLEALLAGSQVLGEEGFTRLADPTARAYWLLDPLDGTLNFASGTPGYSLSLALLEGGAPVIGLVLDGVTGVLYDAIAGGGARRAGVPLDLRRLDSARAPICLSSGTLRLIADAGPHALGELLAINARMRLFGGQALQLCWVASGALGLVVSREAKLWDDAAGALIVREAGGRYARLSGQSVFPLQVGDPALAGGSMFSVTGTTDAVARAVAILRPLVEASRAEGRHDG